MVEVMVTVMVKPHGNVPYGMVLTVFKLRNMNVAWPYGQVGTWIVSNTRLNNQFGYLINFVSNTSLIRK